MDREAIGARIRKPQELFGYTREVFAEKLGVTPKFCTDIELGTRCMSVKTLSNISSVLKLSTDYILFGTTQSKHAFSSILLQRCTPLKQKYAEDILKTFLIVMDCKQGYA